jgi:hypothetical protein
MSEMLNVGPALLQWQTTEAMLADTFLNHVDRGRAAATLANARKIAATVDEAIETVKRQPHADPRIDTEIIRQAQLTARAVLPDMLTTLAALKQEQANNFELPPVQKQPDAETVRAIRRQVASKDPVEIHAIYVAAAQSGDAATLEAINGCHPVAHPNVAAMLTANPDVKARIAVTVRTAISPDAALAIESKEVLVDSLAAVVGDAERIAGVDGVAEMAHGA